MSSSNTANLDQMESHDRFVELCALYSTGELSSNELQALDAHLSNCQGCRELLQDYQALMQRAVPLLLEDGELPEVAGFDRELAQCKERVLSSLERDAQAYGSAAAQNRRVRSWFPRSAIPAAQYAALVIVGILIGVAYDMLWSHKPQILRNTVEVRQNNDLQSQLAKAVREHDSLSLLAEQRREELSKAQAQAESEELQISELRRLLGESEKARSEQREQLTKLEAQNAEMASEQQGFKEHLANEEANISQLKAQLDRVQPEHVAAQIEDSEKDNRINELMAQVADQQRLLAADRDIRELMGARDLLISDVIDVDTNGHNKKPFGRIFYTKNKSLVFYAFDLDKQPAARNASTFQAWGARATGKGNEFPVSMGIFYMDNATARRWVLKLDDPKLLEEIDSVFVTLEPEGGSKKPSGRQLLFSYLRGDVNHP